MKYTAPVLLGMLLLLTMFFSGCSKVRKPKKQPAKTMSEQIVRDDVRDVLMGKM